MRSTLFLPLLLLLLVVVVVTVRGQSIIYMDYTSGFSTTLPAPSVSSISEHTYSTTSPGSFRFGVDWNNDLDDMFSIVIPSTVNLTSLDPFCIPTNSSDQITFTKDTPHQCNYTVNWTTPFNGVMTVTYDGGPNTGNVRSDAISTFFTTASASAVGDPQFTGLLGQSYQVHGIDGQVYNIISENNLQVNALFVFLDQGVCPPVQDIHCWSHPGSYIGAMSFQHWSPDGKLQALLLQGGSAKKGFSAVQVNGKPLSVGDYVSLGGFFAMRMLSTHEVAVITEHFEFSLTNSDQFINQQMHAQVPLSALIFSHGLLGQTHTLRPHTIEGEVDDYVIEGGNIFGDEFVFNRFSSTPPAPIVNSS